MCLLVLIPSDVWQWSKLQGRRLFAAWEPRRRYPQAPKKRPGEETSGSASYLRFSVFMLPCVRCIALHRLSSHTQPVVQLTKMQKMLIHLPLEMILLCRIAAQSHALLTLLVPTAYVLRRDAPGVAAPRFLPAATSCAARKLENTIYIF